MIQTLVQNGHRLSDVLDYTMGQIGVLTKSIYELQSDKMIQDMIAVRSAIWAEEKDFKKISRKPNTFQPKDKPREEHVPESWIT